MTTEELERDLKVLAEPREQDERLRRAIRVRLDTQVPARGARRIAPAPSIDSSRTYATVRRPIRAS